MRTLHGFVTNCLFSAALAALLPACSSTDNGTPSGAAGATGAAGGGSGDAVARGAQLWVKPVLGCNQCHGAHAEGGTAPNITKSPTGGIGAFTLAQFTNAVRQSKNKQGQPLCYAMTKVDPADATDQDIADLYAFQQAQAPIDTPVSNPFYCMQGCCTGEHK